MADFAVVSPARCTDAGWRRSAGGRLRGWGWTPHPFRRSCEGVCSHEGKPDEIGRLFGEAKVASSDRFELAVAAAADGRLARVQVGAQVMTADARLALDGEYVLGGESARIT